MKHLLLVVTCCFLFVNTANSQDILNQGGIYPDTGITNADRRRVHTDLLPEEGVLRLNNGFSVMSLFLYDDEGKYIGIGNFSTLSNGYIIWRENHKIRLSLYKTEDKESTILPSDSIFTYVGLGRDALNEYYKSQNYQYIDVARNSIIKKGAYKDFQDANVFRIPVSVICNNGDIVLGCLGMKDVSTTLYTILALSHDGGITFDFQKSNIPLNELLYDRENDRVMSITTNKCYSSDDHGKTWTTLSNYNLVIPTGYDHIETSPTNGIQLDNGVLVAPMRAVRRERDESGKKLQSIESEVNFVIYSRDFGKTWIQSDFTPSDVLLDEVNIVEYKRNKIMLNARGGTEYYWGATKNGRRVLTAKGAQNRNKDKWTISGWNIDKKRDGRIWDPICNTSISKARVNGRDIGIFCILDMPGEYTPRRNLTLKWSKDFKTWKDVGLLTEPDIKVWGYSSILVGPDKCYVIYEDEDMGLTIADLTDILSKTIR